MADPTRPLTLSDLWLPGDVLGGAMLDGWIGPIWDRAYGAGARLRDEAEGDVIRGWYWFPGVGARGLPNCDIRLDFRRPEVRDRAIRVLGPDLLPIHAAELRGDITQGEAAGLVWCSVVRQETGLPVTECVLGQWARDGRSTYNANRPEVAGWGDEFGGLLAAGTDRSGWWFRRDFLNNRAKGREIREAGRAAADAAALGSGYALREPNGILLLPLPDGVVGRLETSNG